MRRKTHTVQQKSIAGSRELQPETLFEAVLIAEAELASEAARPNPRRNQTSGLKFVLKTAPWRPGDLS